MVDEWRESTIGALCDAGVIELQTGPFGSQLHAYDYVVDGVPVVPTEAIRARRIEGRDLGLPRTIADLFPDRFEDSDLGEIPEGWNVKTVGDLADIVGGSTPSTKEPAYWDQGMYYWAIPKDLSTLTVP